MPRDNDQSDSAESLGARVRALRRERGLTLKGLGRIAGLSHPFLSQLERGLARPSVGSVERIAAALQVPVRALWSPPLGGAPRLIRAGERNGDGVRALSRDDEPLQVHEWTGADGEWPPTGATAPGTVLVYAVRGGLELQIGETVHALAEGDALVFDGRSPHRLRRSGDPDARALYIVSV